MFLDNKYTKIYYKIINQAITNKELLLNKYYEKHHIIPKSLGGLDSEENLVILSAKAHYVCHLLLTKMVSNKFHQEKVNYALWCMINGNGNLPRYIPSARQYEKLKYKFSVTKSQAMTGEGNHFNGWSQEIKDKISKSLLGHKHTEESKKKMSEYRKNTIWIKKEGQKCKMIPKELLDIFILEGWSRGRTTKRTKNKKEILV